MTVKALSLTRPWTELVVSGVKDVENRSWSTPYRGPLVIHGAKSWDHSAITTLDELTGYGMLTPAGFGALDACEMHPDAPTGYLGVVTVTDCHRWYDLTCQSMEDVACCSPWAFDGSWHWTITDARRFPEPIPGNGRLGLWTPPDDVVKAARALIESPVGVAPLVAAPTGQTSGRVEAQGEGADTRPDSCECGSGVPFDGGAEGVCPCCSGCTTTGGTQ